MYLLLVIPTLIWGGNFIVFKLFIDIVPPITFSFIRWLIAFIVIFPFTYKGIVENFSLWKAEWKLLVFMSITGIICFSTLTFIALYYTNPINASLIEAFSPAIISVLSAIFLKEKFTRFHIAGIILSIFGVIWIMCHGSLKVFTTLSFNFGDGLMVLGVISWAIYALLIKKYGERFPSTESFVVTVFIGVILLLPLSIFEWFKGFSFSWSGECIMGFIYVGLLASNLSYSCWNKAIQNVGPGKAAPFLCLIPFFATLFAILILKEQLILSQVIGGMAIIMGLLLTTGVVKFKPSKQVEYQQTS